MAETSAQSAATGERRPGRAREAALRLCASVASVALTLLLVELGLRLFAPVPLHPTDTYLARTDPSGRSGAMALMPLAATRHQTEEFDVAVRINSRGLRDREIPLRKPEGAYRVLVLGDSQTFGVGVEADESYPKVAERRLQAQVGPRVEVLNAGVPSTGTAHQLYYLEQEGWKYQPDAVVVGFFYNDISNNGACRLYEVRGGKLVRAAEVTQARPRREIWATDPGRRGVTLVREARPVQPPGPPFLVRHSHLARWVRERLSRIAQRGRTEEAPGARARELTGSLFNELAAQCRQRRTRLLVVLIPSREQCADRNLPDLSRLYGSLLTGVQEPERTVVDLVKPFRARGHRSLYFPTDLHMTAAGHRLVGERLASRLLELEPRLRRR